MSDPAPIGTSVKVFREDPVWDNGRRWWTVPAHVLDDLYVATYELAADDQGDPIDPVRDIVYIRSQHPDCVLVYA